MTVEASLVTLLGPLVSGRIYPDVAPNGAAMPYLVYQQVGGDIVSFLEKALPSMENGYFQITAWAPTRLGASALIRQAESAVITSTAFQAQAMQGPISAYTDESNTYGSHQQFSIWSDR
jgi:hypothetical protein